MNTVNTILQATTHTLKAAYPYEEAHLIAWELIRHVTQKSRIELLMNKTILTPQEISMVAQLTQQHLVKKVPIAYLTGETLFGDLTLTLRPPILIPRSETESWCYELLELLEPLSLEPLKILDLCTGSGCIALALAHALPQATIVGSDITHEAIALAEENRIKIGINNCRFIVSDLFNAIPEEKFDIIVANPPYIGLDELKSLDESVRNFESHTALFAENAGYAIIESLISNAPAHLRANINLKSRGIPQLLIEIGYNQAETVKALMTTHNYANITLWKDYQGHNRVACAQVSTDDTSQETIT